MIRAGQRHVHQGQEGLEKAFRLPQGQAKEQPEREHGLNGNVRIDALSSPLSSLRRCPGSESVVTHPQGEVATITQRVVIRVPVLDAIRRLVCGRSMESVM